MHAMRARIITSPSFNGDRVLGVILFENTMDREIDGTGTADYLWSVKNVVPFLKVDQGLADEADGAQVMKPIAGLDKLLRPREREGRVRHQDALGDQAGEQGRRRRRCRPAVRNRAPDTRRWAGADHRARGRHQQPPEGRRRVAAEVGDTRSARSGWRRRASDAEAHPARCRQLLRATSSSIRRCCGSSRCRAATRATTPTSGSHATTGSWPASRAPSPKGLSAQQNDEDFDATLDASLDSIYAASIT